MPKISGKVSWFGGPHDSMNTGTAIGVSDSSPGIAVANKKTLGGYWLVNLNGKQHIERQIDYGPAGYTGKVLDVGAGSLHHYGFNERTFPTGAKVSATYLGKRKPSGQIQTSKPKAAQPTQTQIAPNPRRDVLLSYLQNRYQPNALLSLGQSLRS